MEVLRERVAGGSAAGDRGARPKWEMNSSDGSFNDYESLFRAFVDNLMNNKGSFKVDGSLLFEFIPKAYLRGERLISPETSFSFHRMAEGVVYTNDDVHSGMVGAKNTALESYNYQKKVPPLDIATMEEFMPAI